MLFYRFEATADNIEQVFPLKKDAVALASLRARIEAHRLDKDGRAKDYFVFLEQYQEDRLTLGAALTAPLGQEHLSFLLALGLSGVQIHTADEITGERLRDMLERAADQDLLDDWRNWLSQFDCLHFYRRGERPYQNSGRRLRENLLAQKQSWTKLAYQGSTLMCSGTLLPELERIRRPAAVQCPVSYPVHYLIQAEDRPHMQKITKVLLQALYQAGRLESRRYCVCDLEDIKGYMDVSDICDNALHGSLVVLVEDAGEDNAFARSALSGIQLLATCFDRFADRLQLVICLLTGATRAREALLEQLDGTVLVEIREEPATPDQAKEYLRRRAKKDGVSGDRSLYQGLDHQAVSSRAELDERYRRWHDQLLRSRYYPQYAQMRPVRELAAARKPKGNAYQKLQALVGLERVKAMTDQILDYAKAQRLFAVQGMRPSIPSLHMVFTGNPGSAKTTVARLLAEILAENHVLPSGRLFEVGRADLIGKYVGWTAKLVQEAFQRAQGSVLFIDEAYSLVDDRGLYGEEAINTIVQEMENSRGSTVVIFAGYPDKMECFLDQNPGLRSRIAFQVPFDDYTPEQLVDITHLLAEQRNLTLDAAVSEKLLAIYQRAVCVENFGNGRLARNLLEHACMRQAGRLIRTGPEQVTRRELGLLLPEDFEAPTLSCRQERQRTIGFV